MGWNEIQKQVQKGMKLHGRARNNALRAARIMLTKFDEKFGKAMTKGRSAVSRTYRKAKDAMKSLYQRTRDGKIHHIRVAGRRVKKTAKAISRGAKKTARAAGLGLSKTLKLIKKVGKNLNGKAKKAWNEIQKQVQKGMKLHGRARNKALRAARIMLTKFDEKFGKAMTKGRSAVSRTYRKVKDAMKSLYQRIRDGITKIPRKVKRRFRKKKFGKAMTKGISAVSRTYRKAKDAMKSLYQRIRDGKIPRKVKRWFRKMINIIKERTNSKRPYSKLMELLKGIKCKNKCKIGNVKSMPKIIRKELKESFPVPLIGYTMIKLSGKKSTTEPQPTIRSQLVHDQNDKRGMQSQLVHDQNDKRGKTRKPKNTDEKKKLAFENFDNVYKYSSKQ